MSTSSRHIKDKFSVVMCQMFEFDECLPNNDTAFADYTHKLIFHPYGDEGCTYDVYIYLKYNKDTLSCMVSYTNNVFEFKQLSKHISRKDDYNYSFDETLLDFIDEVLKDWNDAFSY